MPKIDVLTPQGWPVWSLPANAAPDKRREWKCAMREWVRDYLDDENCRVMDEANAEGFSFEEVALAEAEVGDYELLRRLHPHLAPHLNPPPRARGRPKVRRSELDWVDLAVEGVRKVRALFRKTYGKSRRSRDEWGVEAIVADVFNEYFIPRGERGERKLTEDAILARMKPSGKHKTSRRKSRPEPRGK